MATIDVQEILDFQDGDRKRTMLESENGDESEKKRRREEEELLKAIEEEEVEPLDETALRKMILNLEKKVQKNQEMRVKYADEPTKFMASEVDLNVAVQELHAVAAVPSLYPVLLQSTTITLLLQLLSHENSDLSIAVINLLQELTDIEPGDDDEEESLQKFVKNLLENQAVSLLVENLERLDEKKRDEADGIHNALGVIENAMEIEPSVAESCVEQGLLTWLLRRVRQKGSFDGNKLYASEILSVLLQQSETARNATGNQNGIDVLLQSLASYKRHNPSSADEREFMENLFDSLCACLLHKANRARFLEGEGLQLMNLMLRERKESRVSALKVLDYATTGPEGKDNCEKFIEILGLRTLFPLFMKTPSRKKRKETSIEEHEEHVCSVINSLLKSCSSANRTRVADKFVEQDLVKVDRLIELFLKYSDKVRAFDSESRRRKSESDEDPEERYLSKLDAGLFTLQLISLILAELCTTGPGTIRERAAKLMAMKGGHMGRVKKWLEEYADHLGPEASDERNRVTKLLKNL